MKLVTISIPEELDQRAATEARRRGVSKSELIRMGLEAVIPGEAASPEADPWQSLAGFGSTGVTSEPGEIDDLVYAE